jgi:hypothetical protein
MSVLSETGGQKVTGFDSQQSSQFATKLIRVGFALTVYPADGKGAASNIAGALGWREVEAQEKKEPRTGFAVKEDCHDGFCQRHSDRR